MTREGAEGRRVTLAVEDREFAGAAALPTGTLLAVGRSDNADLIVNKQQRVAAATGVGRPAPRFSSLPYRIAGRTPMCLESNALPVLPATYLATYGAP
jgi:hypothetical protein